MSPLYERKRTTVLAIALAASLAAVAVVPASSPLSLTPLDGRYALVANEGEPDQA